MLIHQKETSDLITCSYHSWYENFKKHCIKSHSLELPVDVLNYLKQDFFILPKECKMTAMFNSEQTKAVGEASNFENYDDDDDEEEPPTFPEFSNKIKKILEKLDGNAFIKTNWHAPKDAIWITAAQTLRVNDLCDVYQLLKASSICKEDLAHGNIHFINFKKWKDIHPGTEFRCFVRNKNLIAISPRDWPQFHEHFKTQKRDILKDIVSLFKEKIKDKFPIDNYCFDVIRETKDHVKILDFSPFNEKFTAALAFDWEYLNGDEIIAANNDEEECDNPEFRYLAENVSIQPHSRNNYGFPHELIEMFKANNQQEVSQIDIAQLAIDQIDEQPRE